MDKILIVDGHNVIHKSDFLKVQGAYSVESLVNILNSSAFLDFDRIIVVFDASEPVRKIYTSGRVEVILTASTESADTVISQLVEKEKESSRVVVVSDDYSVQLSAIHRLQLRMTSREFLNKYFSAKKAANRGRKRSSGILEHLSPEERKKLEELYRTLSEKEKKDS